MADKMQGPDRYGKGSIQHDGRKILGNDSREIEQIVVKPLPDPTIRITERRGDASKGNSKD